MSDSLPHRRNAAPSEGDMEAEIAHTLKDMNHKVCPCHCSIHQVLSPVFL